MKASAVFETSAKWMLKLISLKHCKRTQKDNSIRPPSIWFGSIKYWFTCLINKQQIPDLSLRGDINTLKLCQAFIVCKRLQHLKVFFPAFFKAKFCSIPGGGLGGQFSVSLGTCVKCGICLSPTLFLVWYIIYSQTMRQSN